MTVELLELEVRVIQLLISLESRSIEEVFEILKSILDFTVSNHIWLVSRNLYHVSFARPLLSVELVELAQFVNGVIPPNMREEWVNSLWIPIWVCTSSVWDFSPLESIFFFGLLGAKGLVDVAGRLQVLSPGESYFIASDQIDALSGIILACPAVWREHFQVRYKEFGGLLNPVLAAELKTFEELQLTAFDVVLSRKRGNHPISENANLLSILSCDRASDLRGLMALPGFEVDHRIQRSLVFPFTAVGDQPTLLMVAAFFGASECFHLLLVCGADLRLRDFSENGRTVADFAVMGGNLGIVRACEQIHAEMRRTLPVAISCHRNDLFFWILEFHQIDLSEFEMDEDTLLDIAVASNNIELVAYIYEVNGGQRRATPEGDLTTVELAAKFDTLNCLHLVLENQEPSAKVVVRALNEAVWNNSIDVVRYLLGRFARDITPVSVRRLKSFATRNMMSQLAAALELSDSGLERD
jgi:hypothetical protein